MVMSGFPTRPLSTSRVSSARWIYARHLRQSRSGMGPKGRQSVYSMSPVDLAPVYSQVAIDYKIAYHLVCFGSRQTLNKCDFCFWHHLNKSTYIEPTTIKRAQEIYNIFPKNPLNM